MSVAIRYFTDHTGNKCDGSSRRIRHSNHPRAKWFYFYEFSSQLEHDEPSS
jgi:hypothetical protein